VSFLSDYGLEDEFVGVVHRVIATVAPGTTVVDITHRIPPHDVRAGALALWRAAPWLVPGVILAVVDPGVGTTRRAIAVEIADARAALVGPDNGLLLPAAHALGPVTGAVELDAQAIATGLPVPQGATFAGRDLFAPIAAWLAAGAELTDVGRPLDPAGLVPGPVPGRPTVDQDGTVCAEVLWVDQFGNAQLNAAPADVARTATVHITTTTTTYPARGVAAYGDLEQGEVGLVTDSYGLLSISLNGSSAAAALALSAGDRVWLASSHPV
jgi:S-adenosylmethionine hydrolase